MQNLAVNGAQTIAYMQATAELNYSEAAKAGKLTRSWYHVTSRG